jgi:hypothetical protein
VVDFDLTHSTSEDLTWGQRFIVWALRPKRAELEGRIDALTYELELEQGKFADLEQNFVEVHEVAVRLAKTVQQLGLTGKVKIVSLTTRDEDREGRCLARIEMPTWEWRIRPHRLKHGWYDDADEDGFWEHQRSSS